MCAKKRSPSAKRPKNKVARVGGTTRFGKGKLSSKSGVSPSLDEHTVASRLRKKGTTGFGVDFRRYYVKGDNI